MKIFFCLHAVSTAIHSLEKFCTGISFLNSLNIIRDFFNIDPVKYIISKEEKNLEILSKPLTKTHQICPKF